MRVMLGIDTGDPRPAARSRAGFIEKYGTDARLRLERMRGPAVAERTATIGLWTECRYRRQRSLLL
jgi:hypothetical protein